MTKKNKNNKSTTNVDIKNNTLTQGNVKITLIKGGKKTGQIVTHNTGTIDMCEYIAGALIGDYVIARRPGIIVPFQRVDKAIIPIGNGSPYTISRVGANASYWESIKKDDDDIDGGFCTAEITFMIPSSIVSGASIDGFQLLSKDKSRKVYAIADLPSTLEVDGDTNIKVEWTIFISYKWDINRNIRNS